MSEKEAEYSECTQAIRKCETIVIAEQVKAANSFEYDGEKNFNLRTLRDFISDEIKKPDPDLAISAIQRINMK